MSEPITADNVTRALAAFERTFVTNHAPYDQYVAGDAGAMSAGREAGNGASSPTSGCAGVPRAAALREHALREALADRRPGPLRDHERSEGPRRVPGGDAPEPPRHGPIFSRRLGGRPRRRLSATSSIARWPRDARSRFRTRRSPISWPSSTRRSRTSPRIRRGRGRCRAGSRSRSTGITSIVSEEWTVKTLHRGATSAIGTVLFGAACGGARVDESRRRRCRCRSTVTPPPYGMPVRRPLRLALLQRRSAARSRRTTSSRTRSTRRSSPITRRRRGSSICPKGQKIHYEDDDAWDFPVGTALVKNFAMPADVREADRAISASSRRASSSTSPTAGRRTPTSGARIRRARRGYIVGPIIDLSFIGEDGETVHDALPRAERRTTACAATAATRRRSRSARRRGSSTATTTSATPSGRRTRSTSYAALGLFDAPPAGGVANGARRSLRQPRASTFASAPTGTRTARTATRPAGYVGQQRSPPRLPVDGPEDARRELGRLQAADRDRRRTAATSTTSSPATPDHSIMVCRISTVGAGTMPPVGVGARQPTRGRSAHPVDRLAADEDLQLKSNFRGRALSKDERRDGVHPFGREVTVKRLLLCALPLLVGCGSDALREPEPQEVATACVRDVRRRDLQRGHPRDEARAELEGRL